MCTCVLVPSFLPFSSLPFPFVSFPSFLPGRRRRSRRNSERDFEIDLFCLVAETARVALAACLFELAALGADARLDAGTTGTGATEVADGFTVGPGATEEGDLGTGGGFLGELIESQAFTTSLQRKEKKKRKKKNRKRDTPQTISQDDGGGDE